MFDPPWSLSQQKAIKFMQRFAFPEIDENKVPSELEGLIAPARQILETLAYVGVKGQITSSQPAEASRQELFQKHNFKPYSIIKFHDEEEIHINYKYVIPFSFPIGYIAQWIQEYQTNDNMPTTENIAEAIIGLAELLSSHRIIFGFTELFGWLLGERGEKPLQKPFASEDSPVKQRVVNDQASSLSPDNLDLKEYSQMFNSKMPFLEAIFNEKQQNSGWYENIRKKLFLDGIRLLPALSGLSTPRKQISSENFSDILSFKDFQKQYKQNELQLKINRSASLDLLHRGVLGIKQFWLGSLCSFMWVIGIIGGFLFAWIINLWLGLGIAVIGFIIPIFTKNYAALETKQKALSDEKFYYLLVINRIATTKVKNR